MQFPDSFADLIGLYFRPNKCLVQPEVKGATIAILSADGKVLCCEKFSSGDNLNLIINVLMDGLRKKGFPPPKGWPKSIDPDILTELSL